MSSDEAYFLFGVGAVALAAGALTHFRNRHLQRHGKTAVGGIIGWKMGRSRNGSSYFPEIEFGTDTGEAIRFFSELGGPELPRLAKPVSVLYDPKNPKRAELKEHVRSNTGVTICLIVGIGFLLGGFLFWHR